MFYCESCGRLQAPQTPSTAVPTVTRTVTFAPRSGALPGLPQTKGGKRVRTRHAPRRDDPGGTGTQIVRQIRVCPVCAQQHPPTQD